MKLTKQRLIEIIKEEVHKLNEGGEKTYKSLMDLEKGIKNLEKTFKSDKRDMQRERASKIRKHIVDIKRSWTAIWADFQGR